MKYKKHDSSVHKTCLRPSHPKNYCSKWHRLSLPFKTFILKFKRKDYLSEVRKSFIIIVINNNNNNKIAAVAPDRQVFIFNVFF